VTRAPIWSGNHLTKRRILAADAANVARAQFGKINDVWLVFHRPVVRWFDRGYRHSIPVEV